ncbi:unnamed protein product [Hermetia illucens]|uniref:Adipose-secreted signaling protein n=1 Tax=Hermetia illucens TaxID=343691 RepID=A0A7R8UJT2_HERIL|nr:UPF0687 protein C20orf27 homolog isoform X1 [Hermetia illucens]CAD7081968.1 unnamed protein product [Hermetia illucens]
MASKGLSNNAAPHSENSCAWDSMSDHHVHFDTASLKDDFQSEKTVTYQPTDNGIIVNLGFLQINHRYAVDLKLPAELFGEFSESPQLVPDISTTPSLHCRITEFSGAKRDEHDYFDMKIEFFAYKEKLLKEQLHIMNSKKSKEILKLVIVARVLGKGKGTPMLRNGIHCIGVERDEESEASDFAGFGNGAN